MSQNVIVFIIRFLGDLADSLIDAVEILTCLNGFCDVETFKSLPQCKLVIKHTQIATCQNDSPSAVPHVIIVKNVHNLYFFILRNYLSQVLFISHLKRKPCIYQVFIFAFDICEGLMLEWVDYYALVTREDQTFEKFLLLIF